MGRMGEHNMHYQWGHAGAESISGDRNARSRTSKHKGVATDLKHDHTTDSALPMPLVFLDLYIFAHGRLSTSNIEQLTALGALRAQDGHLCNAFGHPVV